MVKNRELEGTAKNCSHGLIPKDWQEDEDATASLTCDEESPSIASSFSSDSSHQSDDQGTVVLKETVDGINEMQHSDDSMSIHSYSKYRQYHPIRRTQMGHCRLFDCSARYPYRTIFMLLFLSVSFGLVSTRFRLLSARPTESKQFRQLLRRVHLHSHHPQYTVLVRGERLDATFRAIQRYSECPNAFSVVLDWTAKDDFPPILSEYASSIETDAIVAIDDRHFVSCADLDRSFAVWRADPRRMVGDVDGVMVVHKWFRKTKRWNAEVPLLGLSLKSSHNIWYLGKRYHQ